MTVATAPTAAWRQAAVTRIYLPLLAAAGLCWWLSVRWASMTSVSLAVFITAWLAMMVAMMFPAVSPVVALYRRAAGNGGAAPLPLFLAGYLVVWTAVGLPGYLAWRSLQTPMMDGRAWVGRLAGGVLVAAAAYQLSPAKEACLRACRAPLSVFMRFGGSLRSPVTAVRVGLWHGAYCLGCCWMLMAVLVAVGVMQPWWMAGIAAVIFAEKTLPHGERLAHVFSVALLALGCALLIHPAWFMTLAPMDAPATPVAPMPSM